jgi:hypothetical protein
VRPVLKTGVDAYLDVEGLGLVPCVVTSVTANCIRAKVTMGAGPYRKNSPITCLNRGTHSAIVPRGAVVPERIGAAVLRFDVEIDP